MCSLVTSSKMQWFFLVSVVCCCAIIDPCLAQSSSAGFFGGLFGNIFRRPSSTSSSTVVVTAEPQTWYVPTTVTLTETETSTVTETETSTLSLSWLRWTTQTEREFMTETVTETTTSVDVSLLVSVAVVTLTERSTSFSTMTQTMTTTSTQTMISEYVVTEPLADCPTYTVSLHKKMRPFGPYIKNKEILDQADDLDDYEFAKKRDDDTPLPPVQQLFIPDAKKKNDDDVDVDIDDLVPLDSDDKLKKTPSSFDYKEVDIDDLDLVDGFLRRTTGPLIAGTPPVASRIPYLTKKSSQIESSFVPARQRQYYPTVAESQTLVTANLQFRD